MCFALFLVNQTKRKTLYVLVKFYRLPLGHRSFQGFAMPHRFPALEPPEPATARCLPAPPLPWVELLALALCILALRLT